VHGIREQDRVGHPDYPRRRKTMKSKLIASLTIAAASMFFLTAAPVNAAPNAEAAESLAKKSGCLKCHAVDKTKKASSFQKTAAKWKGKADAEAKLYDNITKAPKVKFEDGTEEDHKVVDSKDAKEIKNLVSWILAQ
jgi:cytochrome c